MTIVIRSARRDEVDLVLELWTAGQPVPSATDDHEGVRGLLHRDPTALFVAEVDGRLVGTLIVGWDGWRAGLYRLVVLPEVRRMGVATQLIQAGEARLRELGARRISCMVMSDHDHANAFWQAMGYELLDGVGRYIKDLSALQALPDG
jgi:ribosomal protein S18 acetylase RimI-like enzyme